VCASPRQSAVWGLALETDLEIWILVPGGRGGLPKPPGYWGGWVGVLGREGEGFAVDGGEPSGFFFLQTSWAREAALRI